MSKSVAFLSSLLITIAAPSIAEPIPVNTPDKVTQETTDIAQTVQLFTVQVITDQSRGSGTLLAKKGKTFLVLTHLNVLRGTQTAQIKTFDGQVYTTKVLSNSFEAANDLALLEFTSSKDYKVPEISKASPLVGWRLFSGGYGSNNDKFQSSSGQLQQVPSKSSENDHLVYSSIIAQGMNGGPIFETESLELVGINGESGLNWGVSIQQVLAEVKSEIATAYQLPTPLGSSDVQVVELTEELLGAIKKVSGKDADEWFNGKWSKEIKPKTKQVTVRIDSSSKSNGSGVIIAKNGSTYTVLTSNHVVCEKDNTSECQKFDYTILTHDGKQHSVKPNTIIRQANVDLAVVQFESSTLYPIATLANYNPTQYGYVFAAGYPRIKKEGDAKYFFSGGFVLNLEQGFLSVHAFNPARKDTINLQKQATYLDGYELVYTSITFKGMSGGPVFDTQGRVIGIHGLVEGEAVGLNGLVEGEANKKIGLIEMGNSLGIPITTFLSIIPQFKLSTAQIKIEFNAPQPVTDVQLKEIASGMVLTRISKDRASAKNLIERGNLLHRQFRLDEALDTFEKAIVLKPKFVYLAYYGKGKILGMLGRSHESIEALEAAVQNNPKYLPALDALCTVYSESGQYNKALAAIDQAIKIQSKGTGENSNYYNQKWGVLDALQNYPEAIKAINKAIAIAPHSIYYTNRGSTYFNLKQYNKALIDYNKAIQLNPKLTQAYENRGSLYTELKQLDKALADHNWAIKLKNSQNSTVPSNPEQTNKTSTDDAESYYNRGRTYYVQGNYKQAIADFEQAIKLNPKLVEAYTNLGAAMLSDKGDLKIAIVALNQALQLDPEHASAHINRGIAYSEIGDRQKAIADFDRAIQLSPKAYPEVYHGRGIAKMRQGDKLAAIADLEKSISLLRQQGRGDEVKDFLKDAEDAISNIKKEGRIAEAEEYLQELQKLQQ